MPMSRIPKLLFYGALAITAVAAGRSHLDRERQRRHARSQQHWIQQTPQQAVPAQLRFPRSRSPQDLRRRTTSPEEAVFTPLRSLYTLRNRGYGDDALSSFILQSELVKKDPRLAWQQHDIDDCNDLVLGYVVEAVKENSNYLLRRKLVEVFGQTNHTVLINRMRLTAVLLGSERGSGGMDPSFRDIREEAHRISPYVVNLVEQYLARLEQRLQPQQRTREVEPKFKRYVDALGESYESEFGVADFGARYSGQLVEEIYAMKQLLRDLKTYYGVREEGAGASARYETIFSKPGTFQSDTYTALFKEGYHNLSPGDLADSFITVGLELREHLSALRAKRAPSGWGDEEEIDHLKKLTEIATSATGLFASARAQRSPIDQARTLVDLLFIEGLYSKKDRKALMGELSKAPSLGKGHMSETRAFHAFLNYMHGLAYAKMDEALGKAARAFTAHSTHAERYLEFEARKSALQVLGQLQQEFYQNHQSILAGKNDIHLPGIAHGLLRVFRSQQEMERHLREDPENGARTIWVLKSGLTMPNEGSFAAIILEDPIMKASHYDGYARSQSPPLPLLQIPGAAEKYASYDRKHVRLEASASAGGSVTLKEAALPSAAPTQATPQVSLAVPREAADLLEIDTPKTAEECRHLHAHAGAKAANYAFLRSTLPLDKSRGVQHIYPGFAIPFHYYETHLQRNGVEELIAGLARVQNPGIVQNYLERIRAQILHGRFLRSHITAVMAQINTRLLPQHPLAKGEALKLRFRSSSNAEDNRDFSGAGLYESHFAFYEANHGFASNSEEDISNAIKRVWASLWKPEAYQARQRASIDQSSVRMGILVHPSYRKEESTGVIYYHGPHNIEIAVNAGNENVQNPRIAGLTPEMHRITSADAHQISPSSCFALSGETILSRNDQKKLMTLLEVAVPKFQAYQKAPPGSGVDIEFKVMEVPDGDGGKDDVVMFKQIRPLITHP